MLATVTALAPRFGGGAVADADAAASAAGSIFGAESRDGASMVSPFSSVPCSAPSDCLRPFQSLHSAAAQSLHSAQGPAPSAATDASPQRAGRAHSAAADAAQFVTTSAIVSAADVGSGLALPGCFGGLLLPDSAAPPPTDGQPVAGNAPVVAALPPQARPIGPPTTPPHAAAHTHPSHAAPHVHAPLAHAGLGAPGASATPPSAAVQALDAGGGLPWASSHEEFTSPSQRAHSEHAFTAVPSPQRPGRPTDPVVEVLVERRPGERLGCRLERMVLADVAEGTAGHRAGLSSFKGHLLTHANGQPVSSVEDVARVAAAPGALQLRFEATERLDGVAEVDMVKLPSEAMGTTWAESLVLSSVAPGSPADRCGLQRLVGCRLTHIGGVPVATAEDVLRQRVVPDPDGALRFVFRFAVPLPAVTSSAATPPSATPQPSPQDARERALERGLSESRGEVARLRAELTEERQRRTALEQQRQSEGPQRADSGRTHGPAV
eukprot:TRINITY_DN33000_c0_g1_i1.p1 TRINITY_DN33000_c0_g1~~TRINITY_DN33000_c0_g1_i1.p1  ORF type:complete len:555 (+),score=170.87 TRINITY_DN33000_c0_g1_i1:184-1665(+)